ncbi:MAG: hypothetical protein KDB07_09020 [Planctomycetes bacterium]|nr:hypothetical protein [Planctomycetota bacterium]
MRPLVFGTLVALFVFSLPLCVTGQEAPKKEADAKPKRVKPGTLFSSFPEKELGVTKDEINEAYTRMVFAADFSSLKDVASKHKRLANVNDFIEDEDARDIQERIVNAYSKKMKAIAPRKWMEIVYESKLGNKKGHLTFKEVCYGVYDNTVDGDWPYRITPKKDANSAWFVTELKKPER